MKLPKVVVVVVVVCVCVCVCVCVSVSVSVCLCVCTRARVRVPVHACFCVSTMRFTRADALTVTRKTAVRTCVSKLCFEWKTGDQEAAANAGVEGCLRYLCANICMHTRAHTHT